MIDNSIEARPQFGIADAPLVYEAIAEGSISRFMAVFSLDQTIDKIGPVRSARPYYIDWAEEFGGLYVHVGGSPDGLAQLAAAGVFNLDQFYNGSTFWRDQTRYAPHNVLTSTQLLRSLIEKKAWQVPAPQSSWVYKPEATLEQRPETTASFSINFGSASYVAQWQYDREKNDYQRLQGGVIMKDAYGTPVRAKNVVVMWVKSGIYDDYGRRFTTTIGSGKAEVFRDGVTVVGTWKRETKNARTRFYTAAGEEIAFNPGTTWIEVVPDTLSIQLVPVNE
jgi:hypothetical protein